MKKGRSLTDLATELERQAMVKRDFMASTESIAVHKDIANDRKLVMTLNGDMIFPINTYALKQVGEALEIPAKYTDRLRNAHPDLLAYNINTLFAREPKTRMIRTLDGRVRAFLSDRYRPLDNYDLATAVLPSLISSDAVVESCEVTESKLYIKALFPKMSADIPPPEGIKMGSGHTLFVEKVEGAICLSNSEIGAGRLSISPAIFTKRCTNLAVFKDDSYSRVHLGSKIGSGEDRFWEIYTDKTKKISDAAVWNQINDIVRATCDGTIFNSIVERLTNARADKIEDVEKCMEVTKKRFGLREEEGKNVLVKLIENAELTRFGLHNAITAASQDVDDYDRATELERIGGEVIELKQNEWQELAA